MIRPILAALLALALSLPAATGPAVADARVGVRAASAPMSLHRLRQALARDMERGGAHGATRGRATVVRPGRGPVVVPGRSRFGEARVLPDRCYEAVRSRAGSVAGYAAGCMRNSVARPGLLPDRCLAQVRGPRGARGHRTLYDARCLRSLGWSSRAARR